MDAITYSYAREHLASTMTQVCDNHTPVIITRQKAKAVVMAIHRYDELQESLALLRMLAVSTEQMQAGLHRSADELFDDLERELDQKDADAAAGCVGAAQNG